MRIILSPAKKMNVDLDSITPLGIPEYISDTEDILLWLRRRSYEELKKLWKCNDRIAEQDYERLKCREL